MTSPRICPRKSSSAGPAAVAVPAMMSSLRAGCDDPTRRNADALRQTIRREENQENRSRVAGRAEPRAVPRPAREGHGASVQRRVRPDIRARQLPVCGLRHRAVQLRDQVRLGLRLARVLCAGERRGDRRGDGRDLGHDPHRGHVRGLRRPSRPRLPGRPRPDRATLLHQFGSIEARGGVIVEKKATFGAGCFWGVEAAFRQVDGVMKTEAGYEGGHLDNPTYEDVCSHKTGHAEVVEVTYDPEQVSYEELLGVFWAKHDPTQMNRQGWDVGDQYRSVVFVHDDEQRAAAERSKAELDASGRYRKPVVTAIEPAQTFYAAEDYHQQYLEKRGRSSCTTALAQAG